MNRLTRRAFLGLGGLATLGVAATASGVIRDTSGEIALREHTLLSRALPKAFEGYAIGFISDIHYGAAVPDEWVIQALGMLAQAKIDLLVFGGDFLWIPDSPSQKTSMLIRNKKIGLDHGAPAVERAYAELAKLVSVLKPRDGAYGIFGNHDHWLGTVAANNFLKHSGIRPLRNESVFVTKGSAKIQIYGVDDYWTGIPLDPKWDQNAEVFRLLLSHNPDYLTGILQNSTRAFDFALCGHTHGGQICWPLVGALYYNVWDQRFRQGLVATENWAVYTGSGLGMVEIPYRINCPSEVAVITLRKA